MKYLSFKILILCILLPPILYIFSLQSIESHLNKRYAMEIGDIYTGDTRSLFDGSVRLKDAINDNIDRYLQSKAILSLGVKAKVAVATKQNTILYPDVFTDEEGSILPSAPIQIAADNFNLMNEGLVVNVDVILEHNTLLSNAILAFYICMSVLVLFLYYRTGIKKARQEDTKKETEIARLLEFEKNHTSKLKDLMKVKQKLISEIIKIKRKLVHERIRASKNEDDLIKEIVALEENLNENIALQNEKQEEINALKEKIKRFEKERQKENKQKSNNYNTVRKRFKTLYKNISVNKRAINGFFDLTDDMKIKGEEIIHKLNEDPSFVLVKRKVFGKKGRATVQEVIFAYKGRLYFRKTKDGKIEILTMGTKNTQAKDLEFLDNI
ncbi:MAG: hypothetical protein PVJ87_10465 [Desulfobacterales bacterium]